MKKLKSSNIPKKHQIEHFKSLETLINEIELPFDQTSDIIARLKMENTKLFFEI